MDTVHGDVSTVDVASMAAHQAHDTKRRGDGGSLEATAKRWKETMDGIENDAEVEREAKRFEEKASVHAQPKRTYQIAVAHVLRAALTRGGPDGAMKVLADVVFHPSHVGPIGEACGSWMDPKHHTQDKQTSYHRQIFVMLRNWMQEDVVQATNGAVWVMKQYVERHGRVAAWKAAEAAVTSLARNEDETKGEAKQHTYPFAVWVELLHPITKFLENQGEEESKANRKNPSTQACMNAMTILLDKARELGLYKPSGDADRKQLKYLQTLADVFQRVTDRTEPSAGNHSATNAAWIALLRLEPRTVSNRTEVVWSTLWKAALPGEGSISAEEGASRGSQVLHVFAEIRQVDLCLLALLRSAEGIAGDQKLCQAARIMLSCNTLAQTNTALLSALAPTITTTLVNECTNRIPSMFDALKDEQSLEHSRVFALFVCKMILQTADRGVGSDVTAARALLRAGNELLGRLAIGPAKWLSQNKLPAGENASRVYLGLHLAIGGRELILRCRRVCLDEVEDLALDVSPDLFLNVLETMQCKHTRSQTPVRMIALSGIFEKIISLHAQEDRAMFAVLDVQECAVASATLHCKSLELLLGAVQQMFRDLCQSKKLLHSVADRALWSIFMTYAPVWLEYGGANGQLSSMMLVRCIEDGSTSDVANHEDKYRDCPVHTIKTPELSFSRFLTHPIVLEISGVQANWPTAAAESLRRCPSIRTAEISISVPVGYLDSNAVYALLDLWEIKKFDIVGTSQEEDLVVLNSSTKRMFEHVKHVLPDCRREERICACEKVKVILCEQFEVVKLSLQQQGGAKEEDPERHRQMKEAQLQSFLEVVKTCTAVLLLGDCHNERILSVAAHLDSHIPDRSVILSKKLLAHWADLPASAGVLLSCASLYALCTSILDITCSIRKSEDGPATAWTEQTAAGINGNGHVALPANERSPLDEDLSEDEELRDKALTPEPVSTTIQEGELFKVAETVFGFVDAHLTCFTAFREDLEAIVDPQPLFVACTSYLLGSYASVCGAFSSLRGSANVGSLLYFASFLLFQRDNSAALDGETRALVLTFVTCMGSLWCTRKPQPPSTSFSRLLALYIRGIGESSSEETSNLYARSFKQLLQRSLSPQWMIFIPMLDALLRQGSSAPKTTLGCLKLLPCVFSAKREGRVHRYLSSNVPKLMEAALCTKSTMENLTYKHALIVALKGGVSFPGVSLSTPLLSRLLALPSSLIASYDSTTSLNLTEDRALLAAIVGESATLLRLTVKNHFNSIHRCIPVAFNTIRSLMQALASIESAQTEGLASNIMVAAQSISRLFEELALLRQELGRYYPHILADYIELAAMASLDPLQVAAEEEVRAISARGATQASLSFGPVSLAELRSGVLALLDACPAAERQMLHIGLPGGAHGARRATLQRLRVDYETSYRYKGKV